MASKKISTGRLDADVQRYRDDGNWRKVIELAESILKLGRNGTHLFLFNYFKIKILSESSNLQMI